MALYTSPQTKHQMDMPLDIIVPDPGAMGGASVGAQTVHLLHGPAMIRGVGVEA